MKLGEPTVSWPTDPAKFYIHCLYRTFFWGPYDSIDEVRAARERMTKIDPYWNYDPDAVVRGDLTPKDQRDVMKLDYVKLPATDPA